jgi:hypothetical protein
MADVAAWPRRLSRDRLGGEGPGDRESPVCFPRFDAGRVLARPARRHRRNRMGLGDRRLPKSSFAAAQMQQAEAASRARTGVGRRRACFFFIYPDIPLGIEFRAGVSSFGSAMLKIVNEGIHAGLRHIFIVSKVPFGIEIWVRVAALPRAT